MTTAAHVAEGGTPRDQQSTTSAARSSGSTHSNKSTSESTASNSASARHSNDDGVAGRSHLDQDHLKPPIHVECHYVQRNRRSTYNVTKNRRHGSFMRRVHTLLNSERCAGSLYSLASTRSHFSSRASRIDRSRLTSASSFRLRAARNSTARGRTSSAAAINNLKRRGDKSGAKSPTPPQ